MRTLYFECYSGISGDMAVAALLDAGADQEGLMEMLRSLPLEGFHVTVSSVRKNGINALDFDVHVDGESDTCHPHTVLPSEVHHPYIEDNTHHIVESPEGSVRGHNHRGLEEIKKIVAQSSLNENARRMALDIFLALAGAEGKVYGTAPDQVHFHEVGAVDSIVDILSVAYCVDNLHIDRVASSPLYEGRGYLWCEHGAMPVPAPATAELAKTAGIPLHITETEGEMVTPTGAAVIAALCRSFLPAQLTHVKAIGIGAGKKDFTHANILRAYLLEEPQKGAYDAVYEITTAIDDGNAEWLGYLMESIFKSGALDMYYTPIYMKKNRPAYMLTVLSAAEHLDYITSRIFKESTTTGLRINRVSRAVMEKQQVSVDTKYGVIEAKRCSWGDVSKFSVEYESAKKAAAIYGCPIRVVYLEAEAAIKEKYMLEI